MAGSVERTGMADSMQPSCKQQERGREALVPCDRLKKRRVNAGVPLQFAPSPSLLLFCVACCKDSGLANTA